MSRPNSPRKERTLSNRKKISKEQINLKLAQSIPEYSLPKRQYQPDQYAMINTFLSKLELGDLCFFDIIDYGIALFGDTKAGKTTLAHYLVRNPLVVKQIEGSPAYVLDKNIKTNKLSEATIGVTHDSETVIPNSCSLEQIKVDNKKVELLDCPGYTDSKGSLLVITNAYFHYRIFSKVQNLKFIITFDANSFTQTYQKPVRTIQNFFKSFKKQSFAGIKDQIFASTVFFLTKTTSKIEENIESKMKILKDCALKSGKKYASNMNFSKEIAQLIDKIIVEKKIFTFSQAQFNNGKKAYNAQILKRIHESTSFWKRQYNQEKKEIDMSSIRFAVGKQINQNATEDFAEKFHILCGISSERFENAFSFGQLRNKYSLENILLTFLEKSLNGDMQSQQFGQQLLQQYVESINIFEELPEQTEDKTREYQKKREKVTLAIQNCPIKSVEASKLPEIQKLQICKLFVELLQFFEENNQKHFGIDRSLQFFYKVSQKIIEVLSQFKKICFFKNGSSQHKKYVSILDTFCYNIYRLIEEAKVFKIVFGYDDQNQKKKATQNTGANEQTLYFSDKTFIILDMLTHICDSTYEYCQDKNNFLKAKVRFFSEVFTVKKNQSRQYYEQIQNYCKKINTDLRTIQFNQKIDEVRIAYRNSQLVKKDKNKGKQIASFIQSVKTRKVNLVKQNNTKNQELYLKNMNQLGCCICKDYLEENLTEKGFKDLSKDEVEKYLKCAIIVFKSINNAYMTIQVYKSLKKKFSEQKFDPLSLKELLVQFAQYAAEHGRKELAMQNLQYAYHLLDEIYTEEESRFRDEIQKKREERQKIAQKIGFLGMEKRFDQSKDYYDKMLTKKFSKVISEKELNEIIKKMSLENEQL